MLNFIKKLHSTRNEEGFTLIELMIVVVIIGILAAIAIPIFANQQKAAIVAGIESDVKNTNTNITTALVQAPTSAQVTATSPAGTATSQGTVRLASGVTRFDVVKTDPNTSIRIDGAWNAYYIFATNDSVGTGSLTNSAALNNATIVLNDTTQAATVTGFGVIYSPKTGKMLTVGN